MNSRFRLPAWAVGLLAAALVTACGGSDAAPEAPLAAEQPAFTLQLLHISDADGSDTTALNSVASLSGLVSQFRSQFPTSTLVVSSGDNHIPGLRFNAANDGSLAPLLGTAEVGRADIALLNALGVQASTIGNHELDLGTRQFTDIIRPSGTTGTSWVGAQLSTRSCCWPTADAGHRTGARQPAAQRRHHRGGRLQHPARRQQRQLARWRRGRWHLPVPGHQTTGATVTPSRSEPACATWPSSRPP